MLDGGDASPVSSEALEGVVERHDDPPRSVFLDDSEKCNAELRTGFEFATFVRSLLRFPVLQPPLGIQQHEYAGGAELEHRRVAAVGMGHGVSRSVQVRFRCGVGGQLAIDDLAKASDALSAAARVVAVAGKKEHLTTPFGERPDRVDVGGYFGLHAVPVPVAFAGHFPAFGVVAREHDVRPAGVRGREPSFQMAEGRAPNLAGRAADQDDGLGGVLG